MFKNQSLQFLLQISAGGRSKLVLSGILILLSSICSLGPYFILYVIIENIINNTADFQQFIWLGVYGLLFILGQMIFSGIAMTLSHVAAYNILYDLRVELACKLRALPLGYYSKSNTGKIRKIMMGNVESIEEFVAHNLVDFFSVILLPILIFIGLAFINVPMALLSILPVILGVALQRYRMKIEKSKVGEFFKIRNEMNSTIIDFIKGMPVIKAFNMSVFSFAKYTNITNKYSEYWIQMNKNAGVFFAIYAILMDAGLILLLPVGSLLYVNDILSLSSFLMFLFLGLGMTRYMKQLTGFGSNLTQIFKGVEEIRDLFEEKQLEEEGIIQNLSDYDLKFENVSFGYDKKLILKNIDFLARQNSVTALVGPSGSGKSTIAQLIPRFWDVDHGTISIGNIPIKALEANSLMRAVSFVFQDVVIFNDSVLENIRMGDQQISYEQVVETAKKAQAHDFIMKLPQKYDTVLGADHIHLSGGEQQRISIARAIIKDAPIVILDEATSFADVENEYKIQKAFKELLKGKTVIVIAHRLSTIKNADQILVIEEGRIVERGNHDTLTDKNGVYTRMWRQYSSAGDWKFNNNIMEKGVKG